MNLRKIILIICLFGYFSLPVNATETLLESVSKEVKIAREDFADSEKQLSDIYSKIFKTFSSDKEFINFLAKDKDLYYNVRENKRKVALPHSYPAYGMYNEGIYSSMYLAILNRNQIKYLEELLDSYCFFHMNTPDGCQTDYRKNIFSK